MNTPHHRWLFCILWLILATATTASAFYDPHIGRWINRDPLGEFGGRNLSGFVFNNPHLFIDDLGGRAIIPGDSQVSPHQFDPKYQVPSNNGGKKFAEKVRDALQKAVSGKPPGSSRNVKCLNISLTSLGSVGIYSKGYEIKATPGPDYNTPECKCCGTVAALEDLLNSDKVARVYDTDTGGTNSHEHSLPSDPTGTNVHVDPEIAYQLPTQNPNGTIGPTAPAGFGSTLWHELVGHAGEKFKGKPASHPSAPWNSQPSSDPKIDPIIAIENQYRCWTGEAPRYRHYFP